MAFFVGTSGYAFKEWKGPFYPAKLPDKDMLPYYASRFPTVEINNTFYRMPREKNLLDWAAQVPDGFRFAIKANQKITHHAQLRDAGALVAYLAQTVAVLGPKLGPTLFQLPPHLKKDIPRLAAFLDVVPKRWRIALEFRHRSWFDDDQVFTTLASRDAALCWSDQDDMATPPVPTASWGYVRLHKLDYTDPDLVEWADRLRAAPWSDGFVYFKHDHSPGSGPPVAESLIAKLNG
ncbi:MAG: DUF72 domain-containing protein [Gemmatimonadales bacterium]|nr:DUF72 domain-containing protein [Gemmatimonadales bacterium]